VAHPCAGDCNADGRVVVSEIVTAVNVVLTGELGTYCTSADGNEDGTVDVSDLVAAVSNAIGTCRPSVRSASD
jgi:hypothetical protein